MLPRYRLMAVLVALLLASAAGRVAAAPEVFEFSGWQGPAVRVWSLRPPGAGADAPVVFVMHGVRRDADRYFAEWAPLARAHDFVLVVPEFPQSAFPGAAGYNLGGVIDGAGKAVEPQRWTYAAIEPIFDEILRRERLSAQGYAIYGHSAGAQFVHRFILLGAGARVSRAVAANAGWYTFADASVPWPYGFAGVLREHFELERALSGPLIVLLGDADTDPHHPSLRRTPQAMAQGAHRFDRGKTFYRAAQDAAARRA